MPLFRYKASTRSGDIDSGMIDAHDHAMAVERLRAMALIPIQVTPELASNLRRSTGSSGLFSKSRVTPAQLSNLTRELATLLRSGLPLDRAVEILISLASNDGMRALLKKIRDDVRAGAALSAALEDHPHIFSRFYVGMVRAGEAGGALAGVLGRISDFLERSQELKETVKSALIYPTILVLASVVSVMSLLIFVVPQFSQMFEQSGKALPIATQVVIAAGDFLRNYWWSLPVGLLAAYRFFVWRTRTQEGKFYWHKRVLNLPLIGDLVTKVEVARFTRTLGTLLANGVPLLSGLSIVKDIVGNLVLSTSLESAREQLKAGRGLSQPLMQQNVFPQLAVHMISVGEETGQLAEMLTRVADVYDREVAMAVKRMLALLEPVMILGLGLIIGGIIISILLAILKVNSLVG